MAARALSPTGHRNRGVDPAGRFRDWHTTTLPPQRMTARQWCLYQEVCADLAAGAMRCGRVELGAVRREVHDA